MAIKNKDGTTFRLQRPNPILKDQNFWAGENTSLHNFAFSEFVSKEWSPGESPVEEPTPPVITDIQDIEVEEFHVPILEVEQSKLPPQKKPFKPPSQIPKLIAWCLPGDVQTADDTLYNEVRSTTTYGEKFSLEIIVVDQKDITFTMWTNTAVTIGSIIFPVEQRRWWKIDSIQEMYEGFMCQCVPSEITPSFPTQQ